MENTKKGAHTPHQPAPAGELRLMAITAEGVFDSTGEAICAPVEGEEAVVVLVGTLSEVRSAARFMFEAVTLSGANNE